MVQTASVRFPGAQKLASDRMSGENFGNHALRGSLGDACIGEYPIRSGTCSLRWRWAVRQGPVRLGMGAGAETDKRPVRCSWARSRRASPGFWLRAHLVRPWMSYDMKDQSFVVQIDTPSVKRYVFGTDLLNEVRGASALLDWLNRHEMDRVLRERIDMACVEKIYANGGSAQFLVRECDKRTVETACRELIRHIRDETGGEVRVVCGVALLQNDEAYREAVRSAHFQLRCQREFAHSHHSAATLPTIMECQSTSRLPAERAVDLGAEGTRMLSDVSYRKVKKGQEARTGL